MSIITDQLPAHAAYLQQLSDAAHRRHPNTAAALDDQVRNLLDRLDGNGPPVTDAQFGELCRQLRNV